MELLTANELLEACISLLYCSWVFWGVQSQTQEQQNSYSNQMEKLGKAHAFHARTSFLEEGQVNSSSAEDLDSSLRSHSRLLQL